MFDNIAKPVKSSKKTTTTSKELTRTIEFATAIKEHGCRLSYGALANAAVHFGERPPSNMSAPQRGAGLVKQIPVSLQPYVCRKSGKYAKGTEWATEVPGDLEERAVITGEAVFKAIETWEASLASEEDEPTGE